MQGLRAGRAKYGLRRYLRRELNLRVNRLLFRVDRRGLQQTLRRLGVEPGVVVCAHSALSKLGFVDGGPDTVIDTLMECVGETGTVLMPTFPTGGSMAAYLDEGKPFDVRTSPSIVGRVTELFRRREGVIRSRHPTNSVAAWGRDAARWVCDHEKSPTPYGKETPYGRLAESDETFILMMETHVHSFLHHLQERVDFPNLFLPGEREATFVDEQGNRGTLTTRIMRPRIPYFVAIPGATPAAPDWAIIHDFALMFPRRREREVARMGYQFAGYRELYRRRQALEADGTLRAARVGKGEIGLLHVRRFLAHVEPELRELIDRFRSFYDPDHIAALDLPYS